ncbi:hypothetical protein NIES3806_12120 [Microcystis aeruginosa NIES-3806]|uniref:DUF433 domain-containing protein n=1 Tax=Microcystis aeruginosa TaxID=1126 RepID=UPI0013092ED9|nr:hypothetical protein NIES3806_12120 [Microcystis aeruginosa NIES-3806]
MLQQLQLILGSAVVVPVRGMRILGSDVLALFAAGLSAGEILDEIPDLEADDLKAALLYASQKLNHPVLVA